MESANQAPLRPVLSDCSAAPTIDVAAIPMVICIGIYKNMGTWPEATAKLTASLVALLATTRTIVTSPATYRITPNKSILITHPPLLT
jgi:hypothetical protein